MPKYDGDMGAPNLFVPIDEEIRRRKVEHLMTHFDTQLSRRWFTEDLFSGLLRLRGMECNSPSTSPRRSTAARPSCCSAQRLAEGLVDRRPARKSARRRAVVWA